MQAALSKVLNERERLLARSDRQRAGIAMACRRLRGPSVIIDRGVDCARFLKNHPLALASIAAGIVVLRTRSVSALAMRSLGVWRLIRRVRSVAHLIGF